MALYMKCEKGHSYLQADRHVDWPANVPRCPKCRNEWKSKTGIGTCNPKADLHVVGTVRRVQEDLYDYADIMTDNRNSMLAGSLLKFEGKRVEVLVNVLEEETK